MKTLLVWALITASMVLAGFVLSFVGRVVGFNKLPSG